MRYTAMKVSDAMYSIPFMCVMKSKSVFIWRLLFDAWRSVSCVQSYNKLSSVQLAPSAAVLFLSLFLFARKIGFRRPPAEIDYVPCHAPQLFKRISASHHDYCRYGCKRQENHID